MVALPPPNKNSRPPTRCWMFVSLLCCVSLMSSAPLQNLITVLNDELPRISLPPSRCVDNDAIVEKEG